MATRTRRPERSTRALINEGNNRSPAGTPAAGGVGACVPGPGAPRVPDGRPGSQSGPPLSEEDAEAHVHGICFKTGPPGQVGVELEWLVSDERNPALRVPPDRVMHALAGLTTGNPHAALPGGGKLSTEPGGQLELSSAPAPSLGGCIAAAGADLATLRDATREAGLRLTGYGIDPHRPPERVLDLPRYAAMEQFFDRRGPEGRMMMCNTASVQVCVDAGQDAQGASGYRSRWRLLHAIGPVLVAAFANSPQRDGEVAGWRCGRQAVWARLDPSRTRAPAGAEPVPGQDHGGEVDPRDAWASYALDAELMCIRRDGTAGWEAPPGLTFRDWLRGAGERRPTADDLAYHLTTLFPPVRPHGHMELRMIDAQPADGWVVPTAVVTALLDDPRAAEAAMAATEPVWAQAGPVTVTDKHNGASPWLQAAKHGPADARIGRAARACFEAADAALSRAGAPAAIRHAVAAFAERYVLRGRCPADDRDDNNRPKESR
ncbi:MAG TPA: ergothioneine biosynthesis glutamate--cysteine ligase EgtA [Streptosporangiaceae bacterium]